MDMTQTQEYFASPSSEETIQRVAERMRQRNIEVVGSQKIVPDLETALVRVRYYILPWEDAQVRKVMNTGSFMGRILLIEREWVDGRMTVILVREPIGI
jgi:hypothetical protein